MTQALKSTLTFSEEQGMLLDTAVEFFCDKSSLATVRDLTVIAQETDALRRSNLESTLLLNVAEIAADAESVEAALAGVIDEVCDATGFPVGHAYTRSQANSEQLVPDDYWRIADGEGFEQFRDLGKDKVFSRGEGLFPVSL